MEGGCVRGDAVESRLDCRCRRRCPLALLVAPHHSSRVLCRSRHDIIYKKYFSPLMMLCKYLASQRNMVFENPSDFRHDFLEEAKLARYAFLFSKHSMKNPMYQLYTFLNIYKVNIKVYSLHMFSRVLASPDGISKILPRTVKVFGPLILTCCIYFE